MFLSMVVYAVGLAGWETKTGIKNNLNTFFQKPINKNTVKSYIKLKPLIYTL